MRGIVQRLKVNILCILETRVNVDDFVRIKEYIVLERQFLHNCASHHLGCIWLFWKPNLVRLTAVKEDAEAISCEVCEAGGNTWFHTFIYST